MKIVDPIRVIVDTDIGSDLDDALALAYLLSHPRCDLIGITTTTGQPVQRARLASTICHHAQRRIPIHAGRERTLAGEPMFPKPPRSESSPTANPKAATALGTSSRPWPTLLEPSSSCVSRRSQRSPQLSLSTPVSHPTSTASW